MENIEIILNKIFAGTYNMDEYEKLPYQTKDILSERFAKKIYRETKAKIEIEPRDFFKADINPHICGLEGESFFLVTYLTISLKGNYINIGLVGDNMYESFKTKEKINGFIEALIQARDSVFTE